MIILIAVLIGITVCIVCSTLQDIILGNRGKKNQIASHFRHLKSTEDVKGYKKRSSSKIKVIHVSKAKNYYLYLFTICFCFFFISILAFKSFFMAFALSLFGLIFPRIMLDNASNRRNEILLSQFKDALNSIMNSLKAGLSINKALIKCSDDLERIYVSVKEKPMLVEFRKIKNDLGMGVSVDDVLRGLSQRLKMEDVDDFVNSIIIVRQKGGNLVEVMDNVTKMIADKIVIKKEITVLTAGKRMEAKIITFIPIFIIISLSIISPSYMKPLYSTFFGKIMIILGFILLTINYFIGRKITNISV